MELISSLRLPLFFIHFHSSALNMFIDFNYYFQPVPRLLGSSSLPASRQWVIASPRPEVLVLQTDSSWTGARKINMIREAAEKRGWNRGEINFNARFLPHLERYTKLLNWKRLVNGLFCNPMIVWWGWRKLPSQVKWGWTENSQVVFE